MNQRTDPFSGEVFIPKRSNQNFASRKNQVAYNNAKAQKIRALHTEIDSQIKKNWQILDGVLGIQEVSTKSKEFLLGAGYDFRLFNSYQTHEEHPYYGVYNYGIRTISETKYEIVKFKEDE